MNAYAYKNCKTNLPATTVNKDTQPRVSVSLTRTQTHTRLFYIQASTSCLHWVRCKWARAGRPHASRVTMAASPQGLKGEMWSPRTSLQLPWGLWHYVISWHRGPNVYLLIAKALWTGPIRASESPSDWSGRWENNAHWAAFGRAALALIERAQPAALPYKHFLSLINNAEINSCRGV